MQFKYAPISYHFIIHHQVFQNESFDNCLAISVSVSPFIDIDKFCKLCDVQSCVFEGQKSICYLLIMKLGKHKPRLNKYKVNNTDINYKPKFS